MAMILRKSKQSVIYGNLEVHINTFFKTFVSQWLCIKFPKQIAASIYKLGTGTEKSKVSIILVRQAFTTGDPAINPISVCSQL